MTDVFASLKRALPVSRRDGPAIGRNVIYNTDGHSPAQECMARGPHDPRDFRLCVLRDRH